jgi:hypothetical protein
MTAMARWCSRGFRSGTDTGQLTRLTIFDEKSFNSMILGSHTTTSSFTVRKKHEYRAQGWQQSTACASEQLDVPESAQILEYFAGNSMTRVPRRFYSPDISSPDFCFDGYAKKQIKNGVITDGDDLGAR